MKQPLAVCLMSGGMDSCVTAAIAATGYQLAFLHLNYGQKTENREYRAFNEIAAYYDVTQQLVVDMRYFTQLGGSSLTDHSIKVSNADLNTQEIPTSYVPFRNANMLSIATTWAEIINANFIFMGAVEEDSSGYPDCRAEFFNAFNRVISEGTKKTTHIKIMTPLINMSKSEIIQKGIDIKAPLHLTWSCYQNEDMACGVCDSCALRLRGFQRAGIEDPIRYKEKPRYS